MIRSSRSFISATLWRHTLNQIQKDKSIIVNVITTIKKVSLFIVKMVYKNLIINK